MNYKQETRNKVELRHGLPQANPWEIEEYMKKEWERQVQIQIARPGQEIIVPSGWHGEGKYGDAQVLFGDVLTKKLSGTELTPLETLRWLEDKGFIFENDSPLSVQEAAGILASDVAHSNGSPIVRAVRVDSGIPIIIEVFHGSQTGEMRRLSRIGNKKWDALTAQDKQTYRGIVTTLMMPFISVGTTKAKERMGIGKPCKKVRRIDDCSAADTTFAGDMAIDDALGIKKPDLDEIGVSVGTTHSLVESVVLAERRGVPLFMRIGAPSFGLLASPDTNYMANTQPDMITLGKYTSGDFGVIMSTGNEQYEQPHIRLYGPANPNNETRLYLNGGGPIQTIMSQQYRERQKPFDGIVLVLRASRIDNGPDEWGVIFSGKNLSYTQ